MANHQNHLSGGFYHRDVVRYKAKVEKLQRRKYELDLMSYRARQLQHVLAWKDAAGLVRLTPLFFGHAWVTL